MSEIQIKTKCFVFFGGGVGGWGGRVGFTSYLHLKKMLNNCIFDHTIIIPIKSKNEKQDVT